MKAFGLNVILSVLVIGSAMSSRAGDKSLVLKPPTAKDFLVSSDSEVANTVGAADARVPRIGLWMLALTDANGEKIGSLEVAHWLNDRYGDDRAHMLQEPINVIFRVSGNDPEAAGKILLKALKKAGFKNRWGHSSGYWTLFEGRHREQFSEKKGYAFSNHLTIHSNDHVRVFGPIAFGGYQYFTGSVSREDVQAGLFQPFVKTRESETYRAYKFAPYFLHPFASFQKARAQLLAGVSKFRGLVKPVKLVPMNNAVTDQDPHFTTMDHDGFAALVELK